LSVAAALGLTMLALQNVGQELRLALRHEPAALAAGELWRLLSAHAVHLSWTHLATNLAGLLLCAALAPEAFQPRALPRLLARLAWLSVAVSLGLLIGSPEVAHYVGLSGVLYGLFLWTLAPAAWRGDTAARLTLAGMLGWTLWQSLAGPLAAEEAAIGGRIVAAAHLYGLVGGAIGLFIEAAARRAASATPASSATTTTAEPLASMGTSPPWSGYQQ
jgi:rhomboid family GlyGly-CTERM serine protease